VFRCPICVAVLADPRARRCPTCGHNLRRRPPIVLGEGRRIAARRLPSDRWREVPAETGAAPPVPVPPPATVAEPALPQRVRDGREAATAGSAVSHGASEATTAEAEAPHEGDAAAGPLVGRCSAWTTVPRSAGSTDAGGTADAPAAADEPGEDQAATARAQPTPVEARGADEDAEPTPVEARGADEDAEPDGEHTHVGAETVDEGVDVDLVAAETDEAAREGDEDGTPVAGGASPEPAAETSTPAPRGRGDLDPVMQTIEELTRAARDRLARDEEVAVSASGGSRRTTERPWHGLWRFLRR